MAAPTYVYENQYSFVAQMMPQITFNNYEVATPETDFELEVQRELALAHQELMDGKFRTALERYIHLRSLLFTMVYPEVGVATASLIDLK